MIGYDDSHADLNLVLKSGDGLIHVTDYYASTAGGGAKGRVRFVNIKRGSAATEIKRAAFEYATHSSGCVTVHPAAKETVFRNEDGTGTIDTEYQHLWHAGTVQVLQRTTVLPVVPAEQNGSGTVDMHADRFDERGYVTWQKDPRGFITRFEHDVTTGALVRQIEDVDTTQVSGVPAAWTTAAGGGSHLVTDFQHDELGRQIERLGPWHIVVLNGAATLARTAGWTVYQDVEHEIWTAQGYATGTAFNYTYTLLNPVSITKRDRNGNVLEEIEAVRGSTAGKLQPTDSFPQSS